MQDSDNVSKIIKTKDADGKDIDLCLLPNSFEVSRKCDIEFRKAFAGALQEGVYIHDVLKEVFEKQGVWTKEHEKDFKRLGVELQAHILLLEKYKTAKDKTNAKKTALKLVEIRNDIMAMNERRQQAYVYSCEGVANEVRMEAYIAYAAVDASDYTKNYYKNYEDFKLRRDEQAAVDLWAFYLKQMMNENMGFIETLPENRFLVEIGYLTDDLKKAIKINKGVKEALDKAKELDSKNVKKKSGSAKKKTVAKKNESNKRKTKKKKKTRR